MAIENLMDGNTYYGLDFIKKSEYGNVYFYCRRKNGIVDKNNVLHFIDRFDKEDIKSFIDEIESHLNKSNIGNSTQFFEDVYLEFEHEFLIIDGIYKFNLIDILILLEDWQKFVANSE